MNPRNIVPPNGQAPQPGPGPIRPPLQKFHVEAKIPMLPHCPHWDLECVDVRQAALITLAQLGGDLSGISEFTVKKVNTGVVVPA